MNCKSGLHKKVSTIFNRTSLMYSHSEKTPLPVTDVGGHNARSQYQHYTPAAEPIHKTVANVAPVLAEDQEYAASQKRKLFVVIGLSFVLGIVLFFNFNKPGKATAANPDKSFAQAIPTKVSQIHWPEPELWPANIKDPMLFEEDIDSKIDEPFTLRGIVHQQEGRSMVVLGTEIFSEGDKIDGWTIKEVFQHTVVLEKPDGKKLVLKMED